LLLTYQNYYQVEQYDKKQRNLIRVVRILERGKWLAGQQLSGVNCLKVIERSSELPVYFFESVQPSSPVPISPSPPEASAAVAPKDIKILTRKPRNVVLAAILKKNSDEPPPTSNSQDSNKQVKFQVSNPTPPPPPPSLPLPPPPSFPCYPRPSLPPRLERLKTEQRERDQLNQMGLYSNFNISIPPPPVPMVGPSTAAPSVPPPGLGFPLPPRADQIPAPWSLNTLPPSNNFSSNAYSLFSSQSWHPAPVMSSGLLPDLKEGLPDRRILGAPNPMVPPSLWSGPGPSPLERLLEQQKALRGANSPTKNSKAEF